METQWKLTIGGRGGKEVSNPDWQYIQGVLSSMDGIHLNEVVLEKVGKGALFVEGGDEGRYLMVFFPENHPDIPSLTLTDLSLVGPDVTLTVQTPSNYSAKYAVRLPLVLKVMKYFFDTGEVPKDVRWELDNSGIEAHLESY